MNYIPKEIIPRNHYINKVKPFVRQSIIKVLTGQRRVGKSYLLYQLMHYLKNTEPNPSIIYINKEDLAFSFIQTAKDLIEYVNQHKIAVGATYLFIDEIQDITDFSKELRY